MNALDIEIAVARHFGWRNNIIVPNVSWGLLDYEADMVIVRPSGWAIEVEIKVSRNDIKADLEKWHNHGAKCFQRFYFAVPDELKDDPNIPAHAGIISVGDYEGRKRLSCEIHRVAPLRRDAHKLDESKIRKLLELGTMRIWSLKEHARSRMEWRKKTA